MRTDDINALAGQRADKKPGAGTVSAVKKEHLPPVRHVFFFGGFLGGFVKRNVEMQIIVLLGKDCVKKWQVTST